MAWKTYGNKWKTTRFSTKRLKRFHHWSCDARVSLTEMKNFGIIEINLKRKTLQRTRCKKMHRIKVNKRSHASSLPRAHSQNQHSTARQQPPPPKCTWRWLECILCMHPIANVYHRSTYDAHANEKHRAKPKTVMENAFQIEIALPCKLHN